MNSLNNLLHMATVTILCDLVSKVNHPVQNHCKLDYMDWTSMLIKINV